MPVKISDKESHHLSEKAGYHVKEEMEQLKNEFDHIEKDENTENADHRRHKDTEGHRKPAKTQVNQR